MDTLIKLRISKLNKSESNKECESQRMSESKK